MIPANRFRAAPAGGGLPVEYVGSANAASTTITIPTHQAGDLIWILAGRNNATAPSLPAGWTNLYSGGPGGAQSTRVGYKIAASGSETSGTWTNATGLICVVYRNAQVGVHAVNAATNTTYPALSGFTTDAWIVQTSHIAALSDPVLMSGFTSRQTQTTNLAHRRRWSDTNAPYGATSIAASANIGNATTVAVTLAIEPAA